MIVLFLSNAFFFSSLKANSLVKNNCTSYFYFSEFENRFSSYNTYGYDPHSPSSSQMVSISPHVQVYTLPCSRIRKQSGIKNKIKWKQTKLNSTKQTNKQKNKELKEKTQRLTDWQTQKSSKNTKLETVIWKQKIPIL